jgi:aminoglycoside phosphotransferase family enzyme
MEGTLGSKQWSAAVAETHISTVLFCADRAYKLLKPVRNSFLDHRTVEARLSAIDQELALNRRVAPDVYLGTADVEEAGRRRRKAQPCLIARHGYQTQL